MNLIDRDCYVHFSSFLSLDELFACRLVSRLWRRRSHRHNLLIVGLVHLLERFQAKHCTLNALDTGTRAFGFEAWKNAKYRNKHATLSEAESEACFHWGHYQARPRQRPLVKTIAELPNFDMFLQNWLKLWRVEIEPALPKMCRKLAARLEFNWQLFQSHACGFLSLSCDPGCLILGYSVCQTCGFTIPKQYRQTDTLCTLCSSKTKAKTKGKARTRTRATAMIVA